jgi:hypothetical protein
LLNLPRFFIKTTHSVLRMPVRLSLAEGVRGGCAP